MQRRDFLKTPALGLLIPITSGSEIDALAGIQHTSQGTEPDPSTQHLHQDFQTYVPGIEHYFLGNGDLQAVIQHCPERSTPQPQTFVGLTLMDAERFARKWSTMLFHPERGLERSAITIQLGEKRFQLSPQNFVSIGWIYPDGVPTVTVIWRAGALTIEERFFLPSQGRRLYRHVSLRSASPLRPDPTVHIQLVPNFALFDEISTDPAETRATAEGFTFLQLYSLEPEATVSGRYDLHVPVRSGARATERTIRFVYEISRDQPDRSSERHGRIWADTVEYWKRKTLVTTGSPVLDHLYAVSRTCAKAGTGRSGRRDSGIWMYNMEWVRDDLFTAMAMLHTGFHEEAKAIFTRILENSVGEDGRTMESSRWYGYDYTELDQNGEILYALWSYLCWTGDESFLERYWPKIRTVAEFPLQEVFRDPKSGLLHNKREFWERNDAFGVEEGFELMHQFWVALGLERISGVAELMDDADAARRWRSVARELRQGMLEDPEFKFIEDGHLIKRRTRAGKWQREMIPASRSGMPPGSPIATEATPLCEPDTSEVYPIIYGGVPPVSELAVRTMEWMEELWNQRWTMGGYSRYNVTSEPDLPGPWPITTAMIARAYVETGNSAMAWRALNWLREIHGGESGWWFERYAPSITPPAPPVSVCGWIWPEILLLTVHNLMGVRPELKHLEIRPRLIDGIETITGRFQVRSSEATVTIRRTGESLARINGEEIPLVDGTLSLPYPERGDHLEIVCGI
jgi:hypothetical protein